MAIALPVSTGAATPGQIDVRRAEDALDEARERQAEVRDRLDELAATYEDARGHASRVNGELGDADEDLEAAQAEHAAAQRALREQIRQAYKQPGTDLLRTSGAFLFSSDVGSALHATALMQQLTAARAERVRRIASTARGVAENIASQREIAAGTAAAMRDVRHLTSVFTDELEAAAAAVADAEEALLDAEALAEQQQWLTELTGFTGTFGYVPPPVIRQATLPNGTQAMTCPVGQPNGFIDSWGFPRSGGRSHQGVDVFAAYGMPVLAAADGYVRRVFNNRLGGLSVDLVDVLGNRYYYAHLSATYVTTAQSVRAGQLLGAAGTSGNARGTPPHLHWQYHPDDGRPVNPYPLAAALCR